MSSSLPASQAFSRSSTFFMLSLSLSFFSFFGPRPSRSSISRNPCGNSFMSSSWYLSFPVVTISMIFSFRSLPMPGMLSRMEGSSLCISASWRPRPVMFCAAVR